MANKIKNIVSNTGPLIHLSEINLTNVLSLFKGIYIPEEVNNEISKNKLIKKEIIKKIKIIDLNPKFKDVADILVNKFSLDLGEAQAISLALQEKADFFLTDDLDARTVANIHGIEVHGTIGVIARAFRGGILSKEIAIKKIIELYEKSSLFITMDLVKWVVKSIKEYKK